MLKNCESCDRFRPFGGMGAGYCESTAAQTLANMGYCGARILVRSLSPADLCPEFTPKNVRLVADLTEALTPKPEVRRV